MINRHILFFILSIGLVLNIYGATELRSTQMRTSDGLPNNSIRYIYQDTKGFLWLATLNGLSRYDGNSFLTFRRKPEIKYRCLITVFLTLQKTRMAFYGFLRHRN